MSVVKINTITVPEGMGPQLEGRFAGRAKSVEEFDGFEDFQLLRPTEGGDKYFVYTRWASEEAFQNWMTSKNFEQSHSARPGETPPAAAPSEGAGHGAATGAGHGSGQQRPASQGSELLEFEVVEHVIKGA
jgi:heme-degrading monooxygenase HmoA